MLWVARHRDYRRGRIVRKTHTSRWCIDLVHDGFGSPIIWQINGGHSGSSKRYGRDNRTWLAAFPLNRVVWTESLFSGLPGLVEADNGPARYIADCSGRGQLWTSIFQSHRRCGSDVVAADFNAILRCWRIDLMDN